MPQQPVAVGRQTISSESKPSFSSSCASFGSGASSRSETVRASLRSITSCVSGYSEIRYSCPRSRLRPSPGECSTSPTRRSPTTREISQAVASRLSTSPRQAVSRTPRIVVCSPSALATRSTRSLAIGQSLERRATSGRIGRLRGMLARLAHVIARRRKSVIAAWLVLTFFGAFSAQQVSKRWFQSFSIPGYSAYEANQRTLKTFGTGEQAPLVAVFHSSGDVTKATGIRKAVAAAASVNPGSRTSSYFSTGSRAYVSKDGHTTFAEIYPPGTPNFSSSVHVKEVRAKLQANAPPGVQAHLTGRDPLVEASGERGGGPGVLTEAL